MAGAPHATPAIDCIIANLRVNSFFGDRSVRIHTLDRGDTGAEFDRHTLGMKDDLEFRHHREEVGEVKVAKVRNTEDLPLH